MENYSREHLLGKRSHQEFSSEFQPPVIDQSQEQEQYPEQIQSSYKVLLNEFLFDRYIPNRKTTLLEEGLSLPSLSSQDNPFQSLLKKQLLGLKPTPLSLLSYQAISRPQSSFDDFSSSEAICKLFKNDKRNIKKQYKIKYRKTLQLQGFYSDYYASLLSCSKLNNLFMPLFREDNFYIYCWQISRGLTKHKALRSAAMPSSVLAYSIQSFGEDAVLSGWGDGYLRKHTLTSNEIKQTASWRLSEENFRLNCLAALNEHQLWIGTCEGYIYQIDTRVAGYQGRFRCYLSSSSLNQLSGVGYNQSNLIAFGTNEGYVKIWDVRMIGQTRHFPIHQDYHHRGTGIKSLKFNPSNPKELITGGGTGCAHLVFRDIDKPNQISKFNMESQVTGISSLTKPNMFVASSGFSKKLSVIRINPDKQFESLDSYYAMDNTQRMIYMDSFRDEIVVASNEKENNQGLLSFFEIGGRDASLGDPLNFLKTTGSFTIR